MHSFIHAKQSEISTFQWSDILVRLATRSPIPITPLQITNRIMRKENLSIALFSHPHLLDLNVPHVGDFLTLPLQYAIDIDLLLLSVW
ncbi:hypothetical protein HMI55_002911 [Coelomomyces lativittatus]|nr:hypothetical protein HMI55_002911 [Coelomomyces lativittatus]